MTFVVFCDLSRFHESKRVPRGLLVTGQQHAARLSCATASVVCAGGIALLWEHPPSRGGLIGGQAAGALGDDDGIEARWPIQRLSALAVSR